MAVLNQMYNKIKKRGCEYNMARVKRTQDPELDLEMDELVLDKAVKKEEASEQVVKSELYSDIKRHVLTEDNKKKAKKGLKIAGIVLGVLLLIDLVSMIIYFALFGIPQ